MLIYLYICKHLSLKKYPSGFFRFLSENNNKQILSHKIRERIVDIIFYQQISEQI